LCGKLTFFGEHSIAFMDVVMKRETEKISMQSWTRCRLHLTIVFVALVMSLAGGCKQHSGPLVEDGKKVLEVSVFHGGYGIDFFERVAHQYEQSHPDVKVNLWGDPRNAEKLRARFIAQDPPDLVYAHMPIWILIEAGQCYPLNEALDSPAVGQPGKTWRDTLMPSLINDFYQDGKWYALTVHYAAYGLWYDKRQFREHGWQVPHTWGELLRLCERIKSEGIDPIAFQGRYPGYINSLFETLVQRIGGVDVWCDMQNLVPGAWENDAVVQAVRMIQELRKNQYIPDEYMGLSHMESQMKFVQGKAAMIPCGTWLANEMKSSIPSEFEMGYFSYPAVEGGKGEPRAINVSGEYWFVPAKAHYPKIGADFLKHLTSVANAKRFTQEKQALMGVVGSDENPPPALQDAVRALHMAPFTFTSRVADWYPTFNLYYQEASLNMLTLDWTPEQTAHYLEQAAEAVRRDKRVRLHKIVNPTKPKSAEEGEQH